jgi:hypothetical protein
VAVIWLRAVAAMAFVVCLVAGSLTDTPRATAPRDPSVLAADFHVHAAPGDGLLPVWEIQREAERRDLDVIAITNHNHGVATALARISGLVRPYPLVIYGQELTAPRFHMAAVGVSRMIDWRLPAEAAIAAIHDAGGVAIAAHPGRQSWTVEGEAAIRALDGVEVAHPSIFGEPRAEAELREFFRRAEAVKPEVAPIGSSDFHVGAPMSPCRTYVVVEDATREGVLDAVRAGRTVATCPGGRVTGRPDHVQRAAGRMVVEQPTTFGYARSTWLALGAVLSLLTVVIARE